MDDAPATDLRRLTSLRAVAALAVFGYHLGVNTDWLRHDRVLHLGYTGVGFFFVLSGFVLTWAWRPGDTAGRFYLRRVARIYPSHLVTALIAVPVVGATVLDRATLANLLLVQAWFPADIAFSLNPPAWSLSCEAFFYLLAPVLIRGFDRLPGRVVVAAAVAWFGLTTAVGVLLTAGESSLSTQLVYTSPALRTGEFVLGIALATLVRRGWRPRIPMGLAGAVLAAPAIALSLPDGHARAAIEQPLLVPSMALLVLAAASNDLRGTTARLLHRRWMVYAGEISFAFYLVHHLVLVPTALHLRAQPGTPLLTGVSWTITLLAVITAAAIALHHLVEKPAQRWIVARARTRLPVPSLR